MTNTHNNLLNKNNILTLTLSIFITKPTMICKYLIHYRYCETKNYFVFNNWYRYHQGRYCLYHWINTNFANCKTVDRVVSLCRINPKVKREKTNMPNMLPNMLVSCDEISLDLFYFFGVWVAPSWGNQIKIHN